jgi:hypothetical protein
LVPIKARGDLSMPPFRGRHYQDGTYHADDFDVDSRAKATSSQLITTGARPLGRLRGRWRHCWHYDFRLRASADVASEVHYGIPVARAWDGNLAVYGSTRSFIGGRNHATRRGCC